MIMEDFIGKGKERVLVSQERMNYNILYVFEQKPSPKFQMVSEIEYVRRNKTFCFCSNENLCKKLFTNTQQEILLGIVFEAWIL